MAGKKAKSVKRGGGRSAARSGESATADAEPCANVSDDVLRELRKLVRQHRSKDLWASWQLGKLARQVLGHTPRAPASRTAIADLARKIGLIPEHESSKSEKRPDESSLRQLMKFARVARKTQAQALQRAKIPWRGIVSWINVVNPKQRSQLYEAMIEGLINSTEIRSYIAKRFRKPAPPRRHVDLSAMCTAAQEATDTLVATLQNLNERLDERSREGPKGKAKRLRAAQKRRLEATLKEAAKLVRATRPRLTISA